jgi:hypothetical protein
LLQSQRAKVCGLADLIADARAQAQNIAAASGSNLGRILAMSTATLGVSGNSGSQPAACTLTVKFQVWGGN